MVVHDSTKVMNQLEERPEESLCRVDSKGYQPENVGVFRIGFVVGQLQTKDNLGLESSQGLHSLFLLSRKREVIVALLLIKNR